jgi:hypothetical protein
MARSRLPRIRVAGGTTLPVVGNRVFDNLQPAHLSGDPTPSDRKTTTQWQRPYPGYRFTGERRRQPTMR